MWVSESCVLAEPNRSVNASAFRSFQLKNRGKTNYCFDYNPVDENKVVGHRVILYPCHGMGQNQVMDVSLSGHKPVKSNFFFVGQVYNVLQAHQKKPCYKLAYMVINNYIFYYI